MVTIHTGGTIIRLSFSSCFCANFKHSLRIRAFKSVYIKVELLLIGNYSNLFLSVLYNFYLLERIKLLALMLSVSNLSPYKCCEEYNVPNIERVNNLNTRQNPILDQFRGQHSKQITYLGTKVMFRLSLSNFHNRARLYINK